MADFNQRYVEFKDEASFGEILQTFDYRIPVISVSAPQPIGNRGTNNALQYRQGGSTPGWRMPKTGSFTIRFYVGGAQQNTESGALSTRGIYKVLADSLGGGDLTQRGGVAGADADADSMPNATGTRIRGGIHTVGQLGDGRGEGHPVVWGNPNTESLVALPGAPAAGDKIRAGKMVYLTDTPGASKRFVVAFAEDAEAKWAMFGCVATPPAFTIDYAGHMVAEVTYSYVNAKRITGYTSVLTTEDNDCRMMATGGFHLQTVGTTTRNIIESRARLEIAFNSRLEPITSLGGVDPHQSVTGWRRVKANPTEPIATMRIITAFGTTWPADHALDGVNTVFRNALIQFSRGEGTAATQGGHLTAFMPSLYHYGPETTIEDLGGVPSQGVLFALRDGPDETNSLTASAFRMALT